MEEKNELNDPVLEEEEEFELGHTDKLVGIFTEPADTFTKMANYPPKFVDWFIPLMLLVIVAVLSNTVLMTNPTIKYQIIERQMEETQKRLDELVQDGSLTQERADQILEGTRQQMEEGGGPQAIFRYVIPPIIIFVFVFVVVLAFFLAVKFGVKGEGTYSSALVSYGLPIYISVLGIVVMVIAAMAMDQLLTGTSVADFMGLDKKEFGAFLLSKVDIFSIWFYSLISIGFAKMFKSPDTGKYFILVFSMWIGFSILFFFLAKVFPFLQGFVTM